MAANILASRMKIDVYGILKDEEELRELREIMRTVTTVTIPERKEKKSEKEHIIAVNKKIVKTFRLPRNLAIEAKRMAEVP